MAFSVVGIANLALRRIGVARISSITEGTEQADDANGSWEYIRKEVLESREWRFAKERVALAQNSSTPVVKYDYAYDLPSDFLRIAKGTKEDPAVYPEGAYSTSWTTGELEVHGKRFPYIVETLSDDTVCLFTDYSNDSYDLYLTYIKDVTDPTKYTARFVNALAFRWAAELALPRTEDYKKYDRMMELYRIALNDASALEQMLDFFEDEFGSEDWISAGR